MNSFLFWRILLRNCAALGVRLQRVKVLVEVGVGGSRSHVEALLPRLVRQRLLLDRRGRLVEVLRKPFPRGLGRSAVHRRLRAARQSQTRRQSFAGQGWRAGQVWATDAGAAPRGKNARGQRSNVRGEGSVDRVSLVCELGGGAAAHQRR